MFRAPLTLTVNNAGAALGAGVQAIGAGQTEIDLGELAVVDSAAVATLLAWQRAARRALQPLRFTNVPANLRGMIDLYGVTELLQPSA